MFSSMIKEEIYEESEIKVGFFLTINVYKAQIHPLETLSLLIMDL
jgi:hypothetical protein